MKINPVGNIFVPKALKSDSNESTQNMAINNVENTQKPEAASFEDTSSKSMSTQDFMSLRSISENDSFKILDEVIDTLKEKIKESGEAMEAISKLAKKASKENIALQILEKTLEAMTENDRKGK